MTAALGLQLVHAKHEPSRTFLFDDVRMWGGSEVMRIGGYEEMGMRGYEDVRIRGHNDAAASCR